jgi:peptide deformylase
MAIRIIRVDEDPILRKMSKPVTVFDERLKVLVDDMVETMHHADGVGLAAPQIGILKQVIVFDLYDDEGPMALINPRIVDKKGKQIEEEGCLSLPGRHGLVERPYEVTVQYEDVSGESYELTGEELLSRVLCHEIDHLKGILYIDKQLEDTEKIAEKV